MNTNQVSYDARTGDVIKMFGKYFNVVDSFPNKLKLRGGDGIMSMQVSYEYLLEIEAVFVKENPAKFGRKQ